MKTSSKIAIAASLALGLSAVASADPRGRDHRQDPRQAVVVAPHVVIQQAPVYRNAPPVYRQAPVYNRGQEFRRGQDYRNVRADQREFQRYHRGDRLPVAYRDRGHVVNDWRSQRLSAPPQGHQWVQNGTDFALVAIATGLIAHLILNN